MLIPIESVLDKATAADWLARLQAADWVDGRNTAGSLAVSVKDNLQLDDKHPLSQQLRQEVLARLGQQPEFVSAALPHKVYPPRFNCYQGGGSYGLHVDGSIMHLPDNTPMRTDLSATLFLSEPDAYEGGELVIETEYGAQSIKLGAGDMVLYPATSLHQVMPVTKGRRIASFFWIESMVRDAQAREMLFSLDQTVQALTHERGAKDEQVSNLNGLYHNLLRRWAL
ncbi:Fe2+-dependent dioxygenase [Dasania marina]|uniref:Fe2+-dependent dioxygenase n=1 Tax=Dasania marina TaxID=471499 RepID=UPI0030D85490|tara:strand:- start:5797 stop:6474 length:678 start_codon:yes stop_codon:yes gene_type:complete